MSPSQPSAHGPVLPYIPICTTCCQVNHQGHDCIEIDKQAEVCKVELEQICEDTDGLIDQIKNAMDKTNCQAQQAETDIDEICDNVKSTFKTMHGKLDEEEKKMLSDLQEAQRRMKKTVDVIADSQMMTQATVESLRSCQIKLVCKDSPYDYVTVTGCIKRDLNNHLCTELPVFSWSSQASKKARNQELDTKQRMLELTEAEETPEQMRVKEINHIKLDCQKQEVLGVVWHNNYIYVVEHFVLMVYSYGEDGTLIDRYEDDGREWNQIEGMCMMMYDDKDMLVVSDYHKETLIWLDVDNDGKMKHHLTQQLTYKPTGSFNNGGKLLVCDEHNHQIHCFGRHGEVLNTITLSSDIRPLRVTPYGDRYIVTDWHNKHVIIIDSNGKSVVHFKHDINGVSLVQPYDVITDSQGRALVSDSSGNQVLLMNRTGERTRPLLQEHHIKHPVSLCLNHNTLYVSGIDQNGDQSVVVYDYNNLQREYIFKEKIIKIDLTVTLDESC